MKTSRREFLQASALASAALGTPALNVSTEAQSKLPPTNSSPLPKQKLDSFAIAARHTLRRDIPGPSFFEGMLLGNGDVGVCAVVRPDALGLHIGKSDCWDIRVSEDIAGEILPFAEILKLWQRASEEAKKMGKPEMLFLESGIGFFAEYSKKVGSSYDNKWPRPWPCGTVWINWDPRWVQPGQYSLKLANGLFTLTLNCKSPGGSTDAGGHSVTLSAFVDWETGMLSVSTGGPLPVSSVTYLPEIDGFKDGPFDPGHTEEKPGLLPHPLFSGSASGKSAEFSCFQYFPALGPTKAQPSPPHSDKDRNFSLQGKIAGKWSVSPAPDSAEVSFTPASDQPLHLDVLVCTPRDILLQRLEKESAVNDPAHYISIPQDHAYSAHDLDTAVYAQAQVAHLAETDFGQRQQASEEHWREYWSRSAVELADKELENIWYTNQYFLACCLRKHKVAPGLFANWSSGDIGTAWHGDYHMDYNCQQTFWGVFSSNHAEMHLPYVELCENLMPMSEKFAKDSFDLPGAFFPLSAYPAPSQVVPYPVPPWGYQLCMTPWTVQSLWWQYLYTQDEAYLRRVYPMLRAAATFLAAYLKKGEDGRYHMFPTVSSENWGLTVDFRLNRDCTLDLALTRFLFDAVIESSTILASDEGERSRWVEIHRNLAPYPTASGPYGEVWIDIKNAPAEHTYNVPVTMAPVFPGEQVGIGGDERQLAMAKRTTQTAKLEGGNDVVYQPLIRARLGVLDLDWFKREVRYCSLPNGVVNDRVRSSGGRYSQSTDFDFMMRMGVWCENFSLPAVLNECMMQSYSGTIRLFPNTASLGPARFENLRAAGAFLVSASWDGHAVTHLSLFSEKGRTARLAEIWGKKAIRVTGEQSKKSRLVELNGDVFVIETEAGERYVIEPA